MAVEEWCGIDGYPNYEVSNFGKVFNIKHNRLLKPFYKFGYSHVCLYSSGRSTDFKVHRLVAEAFILNLFNEPEVNHRDGDKNNNFVENLEWTTRSKNMRHAYFTGLKEPTNCLSVRIVETGEIFSSLTACAEAIDGHVSSISYCLSGRLKSHRGFTFEAC